MNDTDYIFAVARIRVKEKNLLSNQDIQQMISLKNADAVLDFLMSRSWGSDDAEKTADGVLAAEEAKVQALIEELGIDPEIMEILSYPKLFHNLKSAIQEIVTSDPHERAFYELSSFDRKTALQKVRDKDYKTMPAVLQKAAPIAYESMLKTHDSQICDQIIDKACLEAMSEASEKAKSPLLRRYEALNVALTDIKIAARAQKMRKPLTFIKDSLAECSLINVHSLAEAASKTPDDLHKYLEIAGFKDASEALKKSASAFEVWCDNRLIDLIKSEKSNSVSVGPILAYYLARENEIKTARIILTAKANGFPDEVIEERARSMYV